jgi:hypothetical protein
LFSGNCAGRLRFRCATRSPHQGIAASADALARQPSLFRDNG